MTAGVDCIVVGGVADGVLFQKTIDPTAQFIELARPIGVKPLQSSDQTQPEIEKETDQYELHPLSLTNTDDERNYLMMIAVVKGQSLTWAIGELVKTYVENVSRKISKPETTMLQ